MAKTVRATKTRNLAERHRILARLYDRRAVQEELGALMDQYEAKVEEVSEQVSRIDAEIDAQIRELLKDDQSSAGGGDVHVRKG